MKTLSWHPLVALRFNQLVLKCDIIKEDNCSTAKNVIDPNLCCVNFERNPTLTLFNIHTSSYAYTSR